MRCVSFDRMFSIEEIGRLVRFYIHKNRHALTLLHLFARALCDRVCHGVRWGSFILHYMELVTLRCAIYIAQDHATTIHTHMYAYNASKFSNLMPARWLSIWDMPLYTLADCNKY